MAISSRKKRETPGQKAVREEKEIFKKFGLDNFDSADMEILKRIVSDMRSNKWFRAALAMNFGKTADQAKVGYLNIIVEQNWLIIRKLDGISKMLAKKSKEKN